MAPPDSSNLIQMYCQCKIICRPPCSVTCANSVYVYSCQTGAGRTRGRTTQPGNEDIKLMQEGAVQAMKCAKIGKTNETKWHRRERELRCVALNIALCSDELLTTAGKQVHCICICVYKYCICVYQKNAGGALSILSTTSQSQCPVFVLIPADMQQTIW